MDDYGTGYSSIDTLSQWPFTTIKLDQGMIGRRAHRAAPAATMFSNSCADIGRPYK